MGKTSGSVWRKSLWCIFVAAIIASFTYPIRFALFPETYAKLNFGQEIIIFCLEVAGIAWFVVRRFISDVNHER